MKNLRYITLFLLFFWGSGISVAQSSGMVNSGDFYVGSQTPMVIQGNFHNASLANWYNDGHTYFYSDFHNGHDALWYNEGKSFFYANFRNEGMVNYIEDGQVNFEGESVQSISGGGETSFKNLVFNNGSTSVPFHLSADIVVDGIVDFEKGIIDNANYGGSIYFNGGSSHKMARPNSHVNGPVGKSGDAEFQFPIGDKGYYGYAELSDITTSAAYEAQYFQRNSDELYPHTNKMEKIEAIDEAQYWSVKPLKTNTELLLTLPLDETIISPSLLEKPDAINIVRWDESNDIWINHGGAVDADTRTVSALVSEYGYFALARVKVEETLPCELVVYNAITPNADGKNDFFLIDFEGGNGSCTQKMGVQIFDKSGAKVFETPDYGKGRSGGVFDGQHSVGGRQRADKLPTGNYFYILELDYVDSKGTTRTFNKTGYLYLKDE